MFNFLAYLKIERAGDRRLTTTTVSASDLAFVLASFKLHAGFKFRKPQLKL